MIEMPPRTDACHFRMPGVQCWLPANVHPGRQQRMAHVAGVSATHLGETMLNPSLLAQAWLSPGICGHLESGPAGGRHLLSHKIRVTEGQF